MATSITVLNRDTSLPPLLLPNLSSSRASFGDSLSSVPSSRSNSSSTTLSRIDSTSSAASSVSSTDLFLSSQHVNLELKKARTDDHYYYNPAFAAATLSPVSSLPKPTQMLDVPTLSTLPSFTSTYTTHSPTTPGEVIGSANIGATLSKFESKAFKVSKSKKAILNLASPKQKLPSPKLGVIQKPVSVPPKKSSPFVSAFNTMASNIKSTSDLVANNAGKRQRIGPSCDKCRSKKIKCDAKIDILCQDEAVLHMFGQSLHHELTKHEIETQLGQEVYSQSSTFAYISKDLMSKIESREPDAKIIKHLDKIIYFQPCTSCSRKKNTAVCAFSKGFTRADINIFSKIGSRVAQKPIYEMTYKEYKKAGF